jgi:hypothetical protein
VIHRPLHAEPHTENPSEDWENPEGFLAYAPPLIYRLEFVYPHDGVGAEIEDEEEDEKNIHNSILL